MDNQTAANSFSSTATPLPSPTPHHRRPPPTMVAIPTTRLSPPPNHSNQHDSVDTDGGGDETVVNKPPPPPPSIVLRMSFKKAKMSTTTTESGGDDRDRRRVVYAPATEEWSEWEKRVFAKYYEELFEGMELLRLYLMNTRPTVAIGVLALLALSVPLTTSSGAVAAAFRLARGFLQGCQFYVDLDIL